MIVRIICLRTNRGFISLVWPGISDVPDTDGKVRIFHFNVLDMLIEKMVESLTCLKIVNGLTYWQAEWKGGVSIF